MIEQFRIEMESPKGVVKDIPSDWKVYNVQAIWAFNDSFPTILINYEKSGTIEPPLLRALSALTDLRDALKTISYPSPMYMPGNEPTAADNTKLVLEMIEHGLLKIQVYLGERV